MPEEDQWYTLEDEDEMEWMILFCAEYRSLGKGWKDFSNHHVLMAGDICVFELVSPVRFKVQIFRYNQHVDSRGRKVSSKRKSTAPEKDHVLVDRKPKLENYRSATRVEALLSVVLDRKPKPEPEPPKQTHGGLCPEAGISILVDRKPKLEPHLHTKNQEELCPEAEISVLVDRKPKVEPEFLDDTSRGSNLRELRLWSSPAGMQIPECSLETLESWD